MILVNESKLFSIQQALLIFRVMLIGLYQRSGVEVVTEQCEDFSKSIFLVRPPSCNLYIGKIKTTTISHFHVVFRYHVLLRDHDKNMMNVARSNQRQQSKSFPNDLFLITGIKDEPGGQKYTLGALEANYISQAYYHTIFSCN